MSRFTLLETKFVSPGRSSRTRRPYPLGGIKKDVRFAGELRWSLAFVGTADRQSVALEGVDGVIDVAVIPF
jgi:hypothetical protein